MVSSMYCSLFIYLCSVDNYFFVMKIVNRRPVKVSYMRPSYFKRFFLNVVTYIRYSDRK